VGLIAREIEAAGVPTLSMSSAWDITEAVGAPRAAYLDFPLGHQSGAPDDREGQRAIVRAALEAALAMRRPGTIERLAFTWPGDPAWRERDYTPDHTPRGADGKPRREAGR